MDSRKLQFLIAHRKRLLEREFLLELFTYTALTPLDFKPEVNDGVAVFSANTHPQCKPGHLYEYQQGTTSRIIYGVMSVDKDQTTAVVLDVKTKPTPLYDIYDTFTLQPGNIENFTGSPIETTVGLYMLNYIVLASTCGNVIPYINDVWKPSKVEEKLANALLAGKITVEQTNNCIDHGFFIGHFTELCVPTATKKSLTTHPDMEKRKQELFTKYAGQLNDPAVMEKIETELINLDKSWLAGDDATGFLDPLGGKLYNVARKKLYCCIGGIQDFTNGVGEYTFVGNSLSDGWDKQSFPQIANEIRKGSFERGHETMKGGALSKDITRVFQDLSVREEDCGTHETITVDFSKTDIHQYISRNIVVNDELVTLTEDNIAKYDGKKVKLRSPMTCSTKNGLCYKCTGELFGKLDIHGLSMWVVDLSSTFVTLSLKSMHGTKLELIDIDPLDYFIEPDDTVVTESL